jgi:hypothetical protein
MRALVLLIAAFLLAMIALYWNGQYKAGRPKTSEWLKTSRDKNNIA